MFVGDSEHNLVELLRTCPYPSSELLTVWLKVYDPTVSFLQPGVARNIAFSASPTAMDSDCLIFIISSLSTSLSSNLRQS